MHRCPAAPKAAPTKAFTVASRSASGKMVAWFFAAMLLWMRDERKKEKRRRRERSNEKIPLDSLSIGCSATVNVSSRCVPTNKGDCLSEKEQSMCVCVCVKCKMCFQGLPSHLDRHRWSWQHREYREWYSTHQREHLHQTSSKFHSFPNQNSLPIFFSLSSSLSLTHTCFLCQLGNHHGSTRVSLGRLEDICIATRNGKREHPKRDHGGKIEWRHTRTHS